ncbi:MAG TPA: hypothetical protein VGI19_02790 [Candidatus Cybelea sp.]
MSWHTSGPRPADAASRGQRAAAGRSSLPVPRGNSTSASSDLTADQQAQIAAQRQAFDFEAAERAEILREREVLEAMLMAHLKNEDEITKKWIALI